jgi:hypothetical protein
MVPVRVASPSQQVRAIGDVVYDERRVQATVLALMHLNAERSE